jgi:hypothetical protein
MEANKKCTRQGCRQSFRSEENTEGSCFYHDGNPIFHDVKKGWTCCNTVVYDWDEFLNIKGCKTGSHTESAQSETSFFKSTTVSNAEKGIQNETKVKDISTYEQEQKKVKEEQKRVQEEKPKEIIKASDGKYYCGNPGCIDKTYNPDNNSEGDCKYHLGQPLFHDRKKFWTCCKDEAYDWYDFMKLPSCTVGKHTPKYKN